MREPSGINSSRRNLSNNRASVEQLRVQIVFEFLDRAGQGRLLDMKPLGSAGEMQLFSYRQEAAKVT
jgi:hypothetical protein